MIWPVMGANNSGAATVTGAEVEIRNEDSETVGSRG